MKGICFVVFDVVFVFWKYDIEFILKFFGCFEFGMIGLYFCFVCYVDGVFCVFFLVILLI